LARRKKRFLDYANIGLLRYEFQAAAAQEKIDSELTDKFLKILLATLLPESCGWLFAMARVTMKLSAVRQEWPDLE